MRIVVLFNLKAGVDRSAYEAWAMANDIPCVRALPSIGGFSVHAATGMLGSQERAPYEYVEIIDVADMDQFGKDISTAQMQRIAGEFQSFADNPAFITTRELA